MFIHKTKIVCSIGPACNNDETIRQMIKSGMSIARFNFSHGTHQWHKEAMDRVKRISDSLEIPVAILLDTKGPEIRTGDILPEKNIIFYPGQKVEVVTDGSLCTNESENSLCHISISWKDAAKKLFPGAKILIADGLIELVVDSIQNEKILCTAKNQGEIGSKKNVNLIGVHAGLPIMSEKDKEDLKFGVEQDIDFIAASFVSFPEEIVKIRDYLKSLNSTSKIIAKIENEEGLNNIEQIVKEADGIMIARGDLGVQLPTEKIPLAQKAIIRCCRKAGKPVITATQMLDSMILNPRPTRAELTDVSNAVFDGTDAVMLSGETAGGKYPVEAVKTMALITHTTEQSDEYLLRMKQVDSSYIPGQDIGHMVTHSAYKLARNINAKAIIIPTLHGNTARMIGSFRPEQIVIAVTPDKKVSRQLMIQWGVSPVLCRVANDSEMMIQNAIKLALDCKAINLSDKIVMCAGIPISSPLMVNTIKVIIAGNIISRGTNFGFLNSEKKRASGRILQVQEINDLHATVRTRKHLILVCWRITEELTPLIRIADGIIAESGCDLSQEMLSLINPNLVWITNTPDALKNLENDLSVTIDGEQGLIYEGII